MKISILCSDPEHPVVGYIRQWISLSELNIDVSLVFKSDDLKGGNILFLVSCAEILPQKIRHKYSICLLLHASDLPQGRGWSPHVWELVGGASHLTVSMLEVEDKIDTGKIWRKQTIQVPKHALWDEINDLLFTTELALIEWAILNQEKVYPYVQSNTSQVTYYRKRTPKDSQLNVEKSIASQFDIIRVSDPGRYPAFFDYQGHRYKLILEKLHDESD